MTVSQCYFMTIHAMKQKSTKPFTPQCIKCRDSRDYFRQDWSKNNAKSIKPRTPNPNPSIILSVPSHHHHPFPPDAAAMQMCRAKLRSNARGISCQSSGITRSFGVANDRRAPHRTVPYAMQC